MHQCHGQSYTHIQPQNTCKTCYVSSSARLILTSTHSPQDFSGFRRCTALYTYITPPLIQSTYCTLVPTTVLESERNLPVRGDAREEATWGSRSPAPQTKMPPFLQEVVKTHLLALRKLFFLTPLTYKRLGLLKSFRFTTELCNRIERLVFFIFFYYCSVFRFDG